MADNKETVRSRLRSSDLIPRILCVCLALVIWMYVLYNSRPDYEKSFNGVSVDYIYDDVLTANGLTVYGSQSEEVEVTVLGRRGDVTAIPKESIKATVDVGRITSAGEFELTVAVEVPDGVTVKSIVPRQLTVSVQQLSKNKVPVVVKPTVQTSMKLGEAIASVNEAEVKGPLDVIKNIDRVEARPVFAEKVNSTVKMVGVELIPCTASGSTVNNPSVDIIPETVDVEIPIYDERTVKLVADTVHGYLDETNSRITVSPESITLRTKVVNDKTLAAMGIVDSFSVGTIDETLLVNDRESLELELKLPAGVEIVGGEKSVSVTVEQVGTVKRTYEVTDITMLNADFMEWKSHSDSVEVTLRVPRGDLQALLTSKISLECNLAEFEDGRVPATVKVEGSFKGKVYPVGRYFVEVEASK